MGIFKVVKAPAVLLMVLQKHKL